MAKGLILCPPWDTVGWYFQPFKSTDYKMFTWVHHLISIQWLGKQVTMCNDICLALWKIDFFSLYSIKRSLLLIVFIFSKDFSLFVTKFNALMANGGAHQMWKMPSKFMPVFWNLSFCHEIACASKIHNQEVWLHCGKLRKALQPSEVWFSFLKGSNTTSKQSILMQWF